MTNTYGKNQSGSTWAEGYIDVATRIVEFRQKHPDGSLRAQNPDNPITIITIGDKTYLQYVACAFRTPTDTAPGIGVAWELFPGRTPFTRDSEAMVAETSAWGRAIVAALAGDTKKGIASAEEVRAAKARQEKPVVEKPVVEKPSVDLGWQSADEENPKRATEKQVQLIHILRKDIPSIQDEEAYHQRLLKAYGVISTKDLTQAQATDLIQKLEKSSGKQ
jgi:hypothetical protein